PSGIVLVSPIAASPDRIAALRGKWGRLTPAGHRAALVSDVRRALNEEERIGACKRLSWYYPGALEPLALRLLALPTRNADTVDEFVSELYRAKDAKTRRRVFRVLVARHGKAEREGVLRQLFADLQEAEETP